MMAATKNATAWWAMTPVTPFATPTSITLGTGAQDVEKGNIYALPAGSPVTIPVSAQVAWEDSQHVVLQTANGVLNLLHVNPTAPVGAQISPGGTVGTVSPVVGSVTDPKSGISYIETGNIIEAGIYSTVQGAINREVFVNGVDQPNNFSGIMNPTSTFQAWGAGTSPSASLPTASPTATPQGWPLSSSAPTPTPGATPKLFTATSFGSSLAGTLSALPGGAWIWVLGLIVLFVIYVMRR